MKILITTSLYPPDIGGPSNYVPRIAKAFVTRGHEIGVVAPQDRGIECPISNPSYRLIRFSRSHYLRYVNYVIEFWRAFWRIFSEASHYDLIYINGLDIPATLASWSRRKRTVVKIVGDGAWELAFTRGWTKYNLETFQKNRKLSFLKGFFRIPSKFSRAVIVPSQYLSTIVKSWGVSPERIHVVYNTFNSKQANSDNLTVGIPFRHENRLHLVSIGRLVPHKRIDSIIKVITDLPEVDLVVIGSGPQEGELRKLTQDLGMEKRTYFTGQLPHEQILWILSEYAQTLILNSIYEGLPHVILEAASCGVPVIASAAGGTPELLKILQNGLLIQPDSSEELFSALQKFVDQPELRKQFHDNALKKIDRFSEEVMIQATEKVLLEAINAYPDG